MATENQSLPTTARHRAITVEIAPGELLDKITILEIKTERITDPAKLENVRRELAALRAVRERSMESTEAVVELTAELKAVNEALWEIEDAIRRCDRDKDFGDRFIELARAVYHRNDRRACLKRQINELLGATIMEEKSYTSYNAAGD